MVMRFDLTKLMTLLFCILWSSRDGVVEDDVEAIKKEKHWLILAGFYKSWQILKPF